MNLLWLPLLTLVLGIVGCDNAGSISSVNASTTQTSGHERCPDCGAITGHLHELFCLKETCPFCGNQLATCDCIVTELKLTDAERKLVEQYVDDSKEPLKGIMARWERALNAKGRIPVGS